MMSWFQLIGGAVAGVALLSAIWAGWAYVRRLQAKAAKLTADLAKARAEWSLEAGGRAKDAARWVDDRRRFEAQISVLKTQRDQEIERSADVARENPDTAGAYLRDSLRPIGDAAGAVSGAGDATLPAGSGAEDTK